MAFFDDEATASRKPSVLDRLDEAERVGEGREIAGRDQLLQPPLLALGIKDDMRPGVGQPQLLQHRAGAAEARLACDMGLIDLGGEARRIGDAQQRLPPGAFVRRVDENAVHVEDDGGERSRGGEVCWHAAALIGASLGRDQHVISSLPIL